MTKDIKMLLRGIGVGIIITATFYYMVVSFSQIKKIEDINDNYPNVINEDYNKTDNNDVNIDETNEDKPDERETNKDKINEDEMNIDDTNVGNMNEGNIDENE